MHNLVSNLGDFQGRDLVETVVADIRDHVIGKEREFFGADVNDALYKTLSDDTSAFYRVMVVGLQVWNNLDQNQVERLRQIAAECHAVLEELDRLDHTERHSAKFVENLGKRFFLAKESHYKPLIAVIGSIRYLQTAGLYDESPETTQKRLDQTFEAFQKKTEKHTVEQISRLSIALQEEVSHNVSQKTIEEIDSALQAMRCKAALSGIMAAVIGVSAVAFVLFYHESNIEGSYHIASSIARRVTIVTIGLLAVGVLIRLFRSYISSIEGLQHKRRLIKSFRELLVMGGPENSQHVFAQLIAILVKHDFTMHPGEKNDETESNIVAGLIAQIQKSAVKS